MQFLKMDHFQNKTLATWQVPTCVETSAESLSVFEWHLKNCRGTNSMIGPERRRPQNVWPTNRKSGSGSLNAVCRQWSPEPLGVRSSEFVGQLGLRIGIRELRKSETVPARKQTTVFPPLLRPWETADPTSDDKTHAGPLSLFFFDNDKKGKYCNFVQGIRISYIVRRV